MIRKCVGVCLVAALVVFCGRDSAVGQEKRTGTVTGEVKAKKDSPNGKNVILTVQAVGEEKARTYRVQYDPKVKGPKPEVLKAVRASKVGDRVELAWIDTGEGLAITKFEVLKKRGQ